MRQSKEELKAKRRVYNAANSDSIRDSQRAWKLANPERVIASRRRTVTKDRARAKAWSLANPGAVEARCRKWRNDHPEQWALIRGSALRNRRARERLAAGTHNGQDIRDCLVMQRHLCFYCLEPLAPGYHVDHMIPISRGGSNAASNIVCACPHCNKTKSAKTAAEFILGMPRGSLPILADPSSPS